MDAKPVPDLALAERDRPIVQAFLREGQRLRGFVRRRVPDPADVDDILQDVFAELVEAARLPRPLEQVGAWLFRVARNRITDLFRRQRTQGSAANAAAAAARADEPAAEGSIEDWLPSPDAGPEAAFARRLLLEAVEEALDELPEEQRSVFMAHEIEGLGFRRIAEQSGVGVNTLLARKRYAVLHLRRRLQSIHDEFVNP